MRFFCVQTVQEVYLLFEELCNRLTLPRCCIYNMCCSTRIKRLKEVNSAMRRAHKADVRFDKLEVG
jgi:uncharacterized protein YlaN (UPF0358 family)